MVGASQLKVYCMIDIVTSRHRVFPVFLLEGIGCRSIPLPHGRLHCVCSRQIPSLPRRLGHLDLVPDVLPLQHKIDSLVGTLDGPNRTRRVALDDVSDDLRRGCDLEGAQAALDSLAGRVGAPEGVANAGDGREERGGRVHVVALGSIPQPVGDVGGGPDAGDEPEQVQGAVPYGGEVHLLGPRLAHVRGGAAERGPRRGGVVAGADRGGGEGDRPRGARGEASGAAPALAAPVVPGVAQGGSALGDHH